MHALRRFLQDEMDTRGWQPRDLVRASGLSKQLVSNLLTDDRDVLPQLPRTSTLEALAGAFGVSVAHVTTLAVQALGVPGVQAPVVVHHVSAASDVELLRELLQRAERRQADAAKDDVAALPVRRNLISELHHARLDVEEWRRNMPDTPGAQAQLERLEAAVKNLERERDATQRNHVDTSGSETAL